MSLSSDYDFLTLNYQEVRYLKTYYRQLLFSCNLQHLYDPEEILHKVWEKAVKVVNSNKRIQHPLAWSKTVGVNIILQYNRQEKSKNKCCQKLQRMIQSEINYDLSEDIWFDDTWGKC